MKITFDSFEELVTLWIEREREIEKLKKEIRSLNLKIEIYEDRIRKKATAENSD